MDEIGAKSVQKQGYSRKKPCELLGFLHLKAGKTRKRIFDESY